jgi:hypothetical protein
MPPVIIGAARAAPAVARAVPMIKKHGKSAIRGARKIKTAVKSIDGTKGFAHNARKVVYAGRKAQKLYADGQEVVGAASGVANATVRYEKRIDGMGTAETAHRRSQGRNQGAKEDSNITSQGEAPSLALLRARAEKETQTQLEAAGVPYEKGDYKMLISDRPEMPSFPFFMTMFALTKDVLDALDISGVGALLTTLLSIAIGIVLFAYTFGKLRNGFLKKILLRKTLTRLIIAIGIELIPGIKIIPTVTVWVLMNHYSETKLVKTLDAILEEVIKIEKGRVRNVRMTSQ